MCGDGQGRQRNAESHASSFLGIDVSKETFDACCIPSHGERLFNLSASMDRKGFEELIKQLSTLSIPQESVLVGMELLIFVDKRDIFR